MTTLKNLTEAFAGKAATEINFVNDTKTWGFFGFRLEGKFEYHWFRFCVCEDDICIFTFDHSYCQNTGKTRRGISRGLGLYDKVEKITGIRL